MDTKTVRESLGRLDDDELVDRLSRGILTEEAQEIVREILRSRGYNLRPAERKSIDRVLTHYDNLKVTRTAPPEVIRGAYRSLSQKYHPDKNPGDAEAARVSKIINEAYRILSDPKLRAEHDAWISRSEQSDPKRQQEHTVERRENRPRATAETRDTYSRRRGQRVWAGLGVIVLASLALNLVLHGRTPQSVPARPIPADAAAVHPSILLPSRRQEGGDSTSSGGDSMDGATLPEGVTYATAADIEKFKADALGAAYQRACRTGRDFVRPLAAPNGYEWPASSGYVGGYPKRRTAGLSTVTIDNMRGATDLFVKLYSRDDPGGFARHVFVARRSSFTMRHLDAGEYELRYLDLDTGRCERSQSFDLEQASTDKGTEFSDITVTLNKVENGNLASTPIPWPDFNRE